MGLDEAFDIVRRRLRAARRVTVLTGAGVSAASGVPTFRGAGGLWRNRSAQQLATPQAFAGTSSAVYPAAGLIADARSRGAFTIEINPEATAAATDVAIALGAEEALPRLDSD